MITLNLLPDIKREYIKTRRTYARVISLSVLISLAAVGLTILLAVWVYGVQTVHTALITDSIKKNQSKLEEIKDVSKYVTIQNQLANISTLHNGKNDFSRLLKFLPQFNPAEPDNVVLSSVAVNQEEGTITMQGDTGTYTGLVKFRDTLQKSKVHYKTVDANDSTEAVMFTKVEVAEQALSTSSSGDSSGARVSFRIVATYTPEAFASSSRDVTVSVPTIETTPSKRDTPDIFSGGGNN